MNENENKSELDVKKIDLNKNILEELFFIV